ncbi:MAG: GAF domain-containing protein [Chloroflexi bacterium]|nr:MAG: GAF domain-containing protein [Chloroflexota bacterium]
MSKYTQNKQLLLLDNYKFMLTNKKSLGEMLDAIARATLSITDTEDINTILQQIADICRSTIAAQYVVIGMYNADSHIKQFVVSGISESNPEALPLPKYGTEIFNTILVHHSSVRLEKINHLISSFNVSSKYTSPKNFLGTPIIAGDAIQGAIFLTNKVDDTIFSDLDQKLVELLAAHAAAAIRRTSISDVSDGYQKALQQRNTQLAALNEAAMAIAGELSLDNVLQQIVDSARSLMNAKYAALGVPNSEGYLDAFIYSGMPREDAVLIDHLPKGYGLLGAIFDERKPIRIPKISKDKRSVGFPDNHPPMDSFLGVPVIGGGEVLGNLYLTSKIGANEFSLEDQEIVELLAAHAAIAIQNARLYEQVGRLAIVEERTRIGMDLHDGIIQSIYAVGLTLESTKLALSSDPAEADQMLDQAINGLNETIRDIRNFILDLRPHRFSGNLRQGFSRLIREFQANTMVLVTLNAVEGSFGGLPTSVARAIFLTTQEALANVARHARASEVYIEVKRTHLDVEVTIRDDGQGFDLNTRLNRIGHGLSNMQARMEELKGSFILESAVGEGTSIKLYLPLS